METKVNVLIVLQPRTGTELQYYTALNKTLILATLESRIVEIGEQL